MKYILLIFCFLLVACGHGKLEFQTFPNQVDVSVVEADGQIKKLGSTPVTVSQSDINFSKGLVKLHFNKPGFREEVIYLTKPSLQSDIKISANLQEASSAKEIISNQRLEKLSNKIAEAQKFTHSKNYKRAETVLLQLIEEYADISVPYDLLANIYYLSGNSNKALYYYEKASGLAPGNSQREFVIRKIKNEKLGPSEESL
jgi:tetratricopeptide (TPR) repeat protein